ncbi:uncharacterized protein LOC116158703 [Photinus pyralis]|uniref:uncharacterized protein LOC116158703 n=1 Tax=Photinus pyralis TaxID=7054 RepID=UPI001266EC11|nr:uncharacterized protein LOC116158703 [Photinus pyralis]
MDRQVDGIVSNILSSPQLRNILEDAVRGATSEHNASTTSIQSVSNVPVTSVREEIHRLFPTIRANSAAPQNCVNQASMTNVVRTSVKKRRRTIVEKPFYRDIILLQSSKINSTLKGLQKSKAYEEGFAFSNAKFNSNWSYEEIVASIKDLFQHILDGQDFELSVPMSGHLVRLNLPPGVECDGRAIKSRFYQKVIYVRPFVPLLRMGNSEVTPTTDDEYNDNNNNLDEFQEYPEDMHGAPSPNPDGNESIIAENHNIEEIAATSKEGCESQISLTILLKRLNEQVTEESVTSFNVYRNDIFTCCLRALKRSSFSVFNKISVKFSDIEGLSEGAVDAGGPTREMFRLVLNR